MSQLSSKIYWLAGILEGEATFGLERGKYPRIAIRMCDLDIVRRVRDIMNPLANIPVAKGESENHRDVFTIKINGNLAIQWMMTIYSLMGIRRKERIREIIQAWKIHDGRTQRVNLGRGDVNSKVINMIMLGRKVSREEAIAIFGDSLTPYSQTHMETDDEPTVQ